MIVFLILCCLALAALLVYGFVGSFPADGRRRDDR